MVELFLQEYGMAFYFSPALALDGERIFLWNQSPAGYPAGVLVHQNAGKGRCRKKKEEKA